jgi:flagellar biosynthesis/type III secretory pathway protein FliH
MILRNVSIGSERQVLGLPTATASPERRPPQLEVVAQPPPQMSPPPAALTADAVCEWLELQSDETRALCARALLPELTVLQDEARTEGLERGRAHAIRELTERANSSLEALARITETAEKAFALEANQLADACTEIVAEVFLKLAGSALLTQEAILGSVLTVLQRVRDEREVTIRVSPSDLPLLQTHLAAFDKVLAPRRWTVTADSRVSAGGCLVESTLGTLDGRLEVQLAKLSDTLRAAKAARLEGV